MLDDNEAADEACSDKEAGEDEGQGHADEQGSAAASIAGV